MWTEDNYFALGWRLELKASPQKGLSEYKEEVEGSMMKKILHLP